MKLPELRNTDGDPLAPTRLRFTLDCAPETALDALRSLALELSEENLREGLKGTMNDTRRSGALITNYVCVGRGRLFGDPPCQNMLGTEIDAAIAALVLETVTPMALELALAIQQAIATRLEEADRLRHRQVERAAYEADRARHRCG